MRTNKFGRIFIFLILLFSSCMDNGREGREKIQNYAKITTETNDFCTQYTEIEFNVCYEECPEGTHAGDSDEVKASVEAYIKESGNISNAEEDSMRSQLEEIVGNAIGICVKTPVTRPTDDIKIDPKFCACENGKPFIVNDCSDFCNSNTDNTPILYVKTIPGTAVTTNNELLTTKGWCENDLTESADNHAPSCVLQLFDGSGTISLEMPFTGDNSFKVDIKDIQKNKTYVARVVETQSGSRSQPFQVHAIDNESEGDDNSPLKFSQISQYTCIYTFADGTDTTLAGDYARMYFYYPSNYFPEILTSAMNQFFCHDRVTYGNNDSQLFPRLELIPNAFALWDKSDLRLFDSDNNQKIDINEQIQRRLSNEYSVSSTINIFQPFMYNSGPVAGTSSNASELKFKQILQGYYMQPWIDEETKLGYCPKQEQFHSNTAIFRILKEIVGNDTEAIYFAKSAPRAVSDNAGNSISYPGSIILIRKTILEKIWFYYENEHALKPTEALAGQKTLMFFYPPDPNFNDPYVRKPYQTLFTVFNPTEDEQNNNEPRTSILPPNKMFGCVPSLGNASYLQSE